MKILPEVDEAKALMTEAASWSVMKWLKEKKRVRKAADKANHTLWALQKAVQNSWPQDLKLAYAQLAESPAKAKVPLWQSEDRQLPGTAVVDRAAINRLARAVKQADDQAYQAHLDAEETFAMADKRLSTSLAREGCRQAIRSWELYETAITKAESLASEKSVARLQSE
jgi:hypothetical protein